MIQNHEEEQIHRDADRFDPLGSGCSHKGRRRLPQTRHLPANLLQLEDQCGGMSLAELKRLKELEAEHFKLKRMYVDLAMENDALKELIGKSSEANAAPQVVRGPQ